MKKTKKPSKPAKVSEPESERIRATFKAVGAALTKLAEGSDGGIAKCRPDVMGFIQQLRLAANKLKTK